MTQIEKDFDMSNKREEIIVGTDGKTPSGDDNGPPLPRLNTVWDCSMLEVFNEDGKMKWKCGWCESVFHGKNATKAVSHLVCASREDIQICKGDIKERYFTWYVGWRKPYTNEGKACSLQKMLLQNFIVEHQDNMILTMKKPRTNNTSNVRAASSRTTDTNKNTSLLQTTIS